MSNINDIVKQITDMTNEEKEEALKDADTLLCFLHYHMNGAYFINNDILLETDDGKIFHIEAFAEQITKAGDDS